MLAEEEYNYLREMEAKEETVLERQAKMRERAKSLKDKREQERLGIVQDKYDQQFRYDIYIYICCFCFFRSSITKVQIVI